MMIDKVNSVDFLFEVTKNIKFIAYRNVVIICSIFIKIILVFLQQNCTEIFFLVSTNCHNRVCVIVLLLLSKNMYNIGIDGIHHKYVF